MQKLFIIVLSVQLSCVNGLFGMAHGAPKAEIKSDRQKCEATRAAMRAQRAAIFKEMKEGTQLETLSENPSELNDKLLYPPQMPRTRRFYYSLCIQDCSSSDTMNTKSLSPRVISTLTSQVSSLLGNFEER